MPPAPFPDITGVILVGGKSRRMGRDKTFLDVAGRPLFERTLDLFRESFSRVVLVGDRPERFAGYGVPVLPDIYPGCALGGLYTGLYHAETAYSFVASCDLPFPNREVLHHLCTSRDVGFDVVVAAVGHGFEPLFALYGKGCLEPIRQMLDSGNQCVFDLYSQVRTLVVPKQDIARLDREGRAFLNVNSPEEFALLKQEEYP